MKKKFLLMLIIFLILGSVFLVFLTHENAVTVLGIKSEDNLYSNNKTISSHQIELLNKCSEYVDKYRLHELPNNTKELVYIGTIIEKVINDDIYIYGFENSKFQERLNNDDSFYLNGGICDTSYLKTLYYKEMLIIKLKVHLALGEYNLFSNCFIKNYNTLSIVGDYFPVYIMSDKCITSSPEALEAIISVYDRLLAVSDNTLDSYFIISDASKMIYIEGISDVKKEEYNNLMLELMNSNEAKKYISGKKTSVGLKTKELNPERVILYSYTK